MLKKMILINSAEFDYAEIDLEKDIFFAGDNGTGKTSSIIALFYLFSGDNNSRKLGISSDKKSFKEYYFPDDRNSFIVYVFEDFFIFMYKQNGEIFKRFSKKTFEINAIIKEDGKLQTFQDIQTYLKDAPLSYLAKSSAYREIIYGQNRRYLDFKITEIKNYDVFVELFNQTFNVDKSIVDAQSIKRAIQKSLNIEEKNIEFNYQQYMQEIKKFQDAYLFFRKFEKESEKIKESFTLQEQLLQSEEKIAQLTSNIHYRKSIEATLLEEKQQRIVRLEEQNRQLLLRKEQKQKSLNRLRERFAKEIATLSNEIEEIERLKIKFEPSKYATQQTLFNQLPILEKEQLQTQQRLTLLEADVLNALNSIEQEIRELSFKRDNDLAQQKRVKKEQLIAKIAEKIALEKERLRHEKEHTEHKIETEKETLKAKIEAQELDQELEKSKANELHETYREKRNLFQEEQFKIKKSLQEQIDQEENQARHVKNALKLLAEEREHLKHNAQKEQKKIVQKLWEERGYLNAKIKEKKAILFTKEGSFKAFLQQSGISWERELYPFMDSALLAMSTETLTPKVLNADQPLGIELNTQNLKQIPTQEEAEEAIREAKVKKRELLKVYKEEKEQQKELNKKALEDLNKREKEQEQALKLSLNKCESYRQEITKLTTITIPNYEKELQSQKAKSLEKITQNINALGTQIKSHKAQIAQLNQDLKTFVQKQQEVFRAYQERVNSEKKSEEKLIEQWFTQEVTQINTLINAKKQNKQKLSKDDVIDGLKKQLESLKIELQKSYDAHYYLKAYEEKKAFMQSLPQRQSRLIMSQQNRQNLEKKLTQKQDEIVKSSYANQEALTTLKTEISRLTLGLEKSENLKLEASEAQKSDVYLSELIEAYRVSKSQYKAFRVDLKEKLSSINSLKNNPFAEIHFQLENFANIEKFSQDFETLERLSELKDFKEKKLEILKETTNEKYFNFIKSEIPSKLGSLSHSEDKFQEQVKKINKNLSTIDFSIIKEIKINPEVGNKRSVMTLLNEMNTLVQNLTLTDNKSSLFFDRPETNQELQKIANLLTEIKETLKGGAITLLDTIDLSLEFVENGTKKSNVTQIKNESSTGGTILLKMALAISILGLYTQEKSSTFFLILDEVSRLHSQNQDLLRHFANSRGFRIVFVTPEPVYAKPDEIKYYKFQRRADNRFEVIGLNV